MQANNTSPYAMEASELPGMRSLLLFLQQYNRELQVVTKTDFDAFFHSVEDLGNPSLSIKNEKAKAWIATLYKTLSDQQHFNKMVLINKYRNFCRHSAEPRDTAVPWYMKSWKGYWHAFYYGWEWRDFYGDQSNYVGPAFYYASGPATWGTQLAALYEAWKKTPPATAEVDPGMLIEKHMDYFNVSDKAINNWATVLPDLNTNIAPLWTSLHDTVKTMIKGETTLTAPDYLFFLHLFIGLPTGSKEAGSLAKKLTEQSADTKDYPTDSFVNHLLFAVLLHLSKLGFEDSQLDDFLKQTRDNIRIPAEPKQEALKPHFQNLKTVYEALITGIDVQRRRLNGDPSYPDGSWNYDSRMATVLEALAKMKKAAA